MERRRGSFNGNRNGNRNGRSSNFGKRTFGPTDAYELPSSASTLEEKVIVAALKRCGGDGVPSRSLQREAGIHDKVKIMIGGAPVTQSFCEQIGADCYTPDAASAADAAVAFCKATA